jgi:hypothetical protein
LSIAIVGDFWQGPLVYKHRDLTNRVFRAKIYTAVKQAKTMSQYDNLCKYLAEKHPDR